MDGSLVVGTDRLGALLPLIADFAFETDAAGRFRLVHAVPLGWVEAELLGRPASDLLAMPGGFDPFAATIGYTDRTVALRRADGSTLWLLMSGEPCGTGMRGAGRDPARVDSSAATALRHTDVLERILWQVRQEVLAERMMQAVLEGLLAALAAEGAAVIDLLSEPGQAAVQHAAGSEPGTELPGLLASLADDMADPASHLLGTRPLLTCPTYTRFGRRAGLCVWRAPGAPGWQVEDSRLVSSVTTIIRMVLEHGAIQLELAQQARTDGLTGLLNRRAFLEEAGRRIDRLDREQLPGTLIFVDLDRFKDLNDTCGHEAGDQALIHTATLLRNTVRPADLVARLGGDEFALWLDGSDQLTAAERADRLCKMAPTFFAAHLPAGAPPLSASVGIAARHPHLMETLDEVIRRADLAMYEAKRAGPSQWRVARDLFD